jgi:DNA-directed RNA polymerase subunit RPC12/RpoP
MGTATDTLMVVRCPYCVLGEEFRPMVAHLDGRFICSKCGHLANPFNKDFKCSCPECSNLRAVKYRVKCR